MNNKFLNLTKLLGGTNEIIKINNLNNMIDNDVSSSTSSEYTVSYLNNLESSDDSDSYYYDIDGGKGKMKKKSKKHKSKKHKSKKHKSKKYSDDVFVNSVDSETDSELEEQIKESLKTNQSGVKSLLSNLAKLIKPSVDSEQELGDIINKYVNKQKTNNTSNLSNLANLLQIQNIKNPKINYDELSKQSFTVVPMLVPTSMIEK